MFKMIQIDKYSKKYEIALGRRNSAQYATKLDSELKTPEWMELYSKLKSLDKITKVSEFDENETQLVKLFEQLYEKITAPGLDAFISWVESSTTSKNTENIKKFKKYLKGEYDNYADEIEGILTSKEIISNFPADSIFGKLISNFESKIKRLITNFIDSDKFENEIDGLLSKIKLEMDNVSTITELNFILFNQLFTEEQAKDEKLSFYNDIFENIRKKYQSIEFQKGEDKNTDLYIRINNRISSVKKCITLLVETNIAKDEDEVLKGMFLKFQKEMPVVEDDYLQSLKGFVDNDWENLSDKYYQIKVFYSNAPLSFKPVSFPDLRKGGDLKNLIDSYNLILKDGDIIIKPAATVNEIKSAINKKSKTIKDLNSDIEKCRISVKEEMTEFIEKYNKQKTMLEKTIEDKEDLKEDFDSIYGEDGALDNLSNGIDEYLSDGSSLLKALSQGIIAQMVDLMKTTTEKFEETLKKTGLKDSIEWLNDLSDYNLSAEFLDADKIKQLLSKGLIKIELTKTYK